MIYGALHRLERKDGVCAELREALEKSRKYLAERAVLGAMLLDSSVIGRVMDQLRPQDFSDKMHGQIYWVMCAIHLSAMPIDIESLSKELRDLGSLKKVGGVKYLVSLTKRLPVPTPVEEYIWLIKGPAELEKLQTRSRSKLKPGGKVQQ